MLTITEGFGSRLREERERRGLNQSQFAAVAGIRRMAQGQYEHESHSPTVRYLAAVASTGIDLHYVLFGSRAIASSQEKRDAERQVFELIEQYAQQQPDGRLGAEARFTMFELLRNAVLQSHSLPLTGAQQTPLTQ